jgi:hypothetical protein
MSRKVAFLLLVVGLIIVSACADSLPEVPDVVGLPPEEAEEEVANSGLQVEIHEEIDLDIDKATVTSQDPKAGTELDEEETVRLVVSAPPPSVPDVIGLEEMHAIQELEDLDYEVQITNDYFDDAELGQVVAQRPAGGARHDPDRPVQITVAAEFLSPEVKGYFLLIGDSDSVVTSNGGCEGSRGYSDISAVAQVVVRNESGTVLATTSLGQGEFLGTDQCYFEFSLGSLPRAQFYSFEISRRGELTYSLSELEENNWLFEASLGRN